MLGKDEAATKRRLAVQRYAIVARARPRPTASASTIPIPIQAAVIRVLSSGSWPAAPRAHAHAGRRAAARATRKARAATANSMARSPAKAVWSTRGTPGRSIADARFACLLRTLCSVETAGAGGAHGPADHGGGRGRTVARRSERCRRTLRRRARSSIRARRRRAVHRCRSIDAWRSASVHGTSRQERRHSTGVQRKREPKRSRG